MLKKFRFHNIKSLSKFILALSFAKKIFKLILKRTVFEMSATIAPNQESILILAMKKWPTCNGL